MNLIGYYRLITFYGYTELPKRTTTYKTNHFI